LLSWGQVDEQRMPAAPTASVEDQILFWPGGGGKLQMEQMPDRSYKIVGTWSSWTEAHTMEVEEQGVFGFTMTLGENRWEQFQIWLDGDASRKLHPGEIKAGKGGQVFGPEEDFEGCNWLLDGRGEHGMHNSGTAIVMKGPDFGVPGDQYRIRLYVAGKWRTVSWEKLPPAAEDEGEGVLVAQPVLAGTYFIAGTWNNWQLQEMTRDETSPGVWYFDITIKLFAEEFQIARNMDWNQVLYPNRPEAAGDGSAEVLGPDDFGHGLNWYLKGATGETFRVEFQRIIDAETDTKRVTWRRIDAE